MRLFLLIGVLSFCFYVPVRAQEDFSWWNRVHQWDGHTAWVQYMTISSAFMGPNSLPVPEMKKGILGPDAEFEQQAGIANGDGDRTQDFFSRLYVPVAKGKTALEFYVVPLEFFSMDTTTRDTRAARTKSGKGYAGGDIYFSTHVQLLENKKHLPDVMLELAFRTASGTNLRNARYTDASGYFFDLSAGKSYPTGKTVMKEIRPYVLAGFYSYQTYDLQHPQNDALLFGAGIDFTVKKILVSQQFSGYSGYLKNGDQPVVYRCIVRWQRIHFDWKIAFEQGLHDDSYQRIRAGMIYHLAMKN